MERDEAIALAAERVRQRSVPDPESGCILWTAKSRNPMNYGCIRLPGSNGPLVLAHRVVVEEAQGPIPEGMVVDHVCHSRDLACPGGRTCVHRLCVNVEHLEIVTFAENVARGRSAGKTHCIRGHAFDERNTGRLKGARRCLRCHADRQRRYNQQAAFRAAQVRAA
jgi:hypothetical protein